MEKLLQTPLSPSLIEMTFISSTQTLIKHLLSHQYQELWNLLSHCPPGTRLTAGQINKQVDGNRLCKEGSGKGALLEAPRTAVAQTVVLAEWKGGRPAGRREVGCRLEAGLEA